MAAIGERDLISPIPILPDASCAAHPNPDMWFVDTGGPFLNEARTICHSCPERIACLQFALENAEPWGLWGGLAPSERQTLSAA